MSDIDPSAVLRSEIAAYYAGFGQPEMLRAAFEQALLVVPLIEQDRVFTSQVGGVDWICAFTSVEEYARYMSARGVDPDQQYRYHTLLGSRLAEYAASRAEPTGVAVDMAGTAPMAFPPNVSETSLAGDGNR
ncbi:SseB family protein [Nocardia sp. NPDC049737]|uniref:SseB family protein n=1 Tax=Nocardia sp. NPDC049737 TaxID=3154358 RepID=UPI00342D642E